MSRLPASLTDTTICDGDLPWQTAAAFRHPMEIACDIETSGLDWAGDRIGTCTLYSEASGVLIVRISGQPPTNLCGLLEDPAPRKIFHHAMFDLRFMAHKWSVRPQNIACTKVAAKLLDRDEQGGSSLKALVAHYCGVTLDKSLQLSDWTSDHLTAGQRSYAAGDVVYLPQLLHALLTELKDRGLAELAEECFRHIPARVQLDIRGYKDVFTY